MKQARVNSICNLITDFRTTVVIYV